MIRVRVRRPFKGYNSMTRVTNTILSTSIPNLQYKIYLNRRLTLTLITPNRPSCCVSWNCNPFKYILYCGLGILGDRIVFVMRVMEL